MLHNLHFGTSRKRTTKFSLKQLIALVWLAGLPLLNLLMIPAASASPLQLDTNMESTWRRTDQFVAEGTANHSWVWGPQAFVITSEPYEGTPGGDGIMAGQRLVAYYDKSRMEINNPNGDRSNKYFVTNGLLVKELISGKQAEGDIRSTSYLPAEIPVVGDGTQNPKAPTYASLASVTSLNLGQNSATNRMGQTVTAYIDHDAAPREDLTYNHYNVKIAYYDGTFGHNVPDVFWSFMNSQGKVLENGKTVTGPVIDWLFSTGYPITEPYWTRATVAGVEKDVMVQCFERRCYSYTPSNPDPYKVEMGNVGQHYYKWRYDRPVFNCQNPPVRGFGKIWSGNPSVQERLGCPNSYTSEIGTQVLSENFEHGKMYLVNTPQTFYPSLQYNKTIFIAFDDGTWASVQDTWNDSQAPNGGLTPPPGFYEPQRDLGSVWHNQTGLQVRDRLGWATQKEQSGVGAALPYDGGLMLYFGTTKDIFVGYSYYGRTNVWELYPDTFVD